MTSLPPARPSRPVDKEKAEQELAQNVKKAVSAEEIAPKAKHVRSELFFLLCRYRCAQPAGAERLIGDIDICLCCTS